MLMAESASHVQLLIYQAKQIQVIQKEDNFGRLVFHCLLRRQWKPLRDVTMG